MIEPTLYRILCKPHDIFEKDESYAAAKRLSLEIVGSQTKREQASVDKGTVVRLGPTVDTNLAVEIGDGVVWARHSGKEVEDPEDGLVYVILNDEDLVAIIRNGG